MNSYCKKKNLKKLKILVRILLDHESNQNIDIDRGASGDELTALHMAAFGGHTDVCRELLGNITFFCSIDFFILI